MSILQGNLHSRKEHNPIALDSTSVSALIASLDRAAVALAAALFAIKEHKVFLKTIEPSHDGRLVGEGSGVIVYSASEFRIEG